ADHRRTPQVVDLVLVADPDPGRARLDLADQLEQDDLLLERLEDRAQRAVEVEQTAPGQVGRAGQRDPLPCRSTRVSSRTVASVVIVGRSPTLTSSTNACTS